MRWLKKYPPKYWEIREREGFLLFPMEVGGEWRWLERARWSEHWARRFWEADYWIDDEPRYVLTDAGRKHLAGEK